MKKLYFISLINLLALLQVYAQVDQTLAKVNTTLASDRIFDDSKKTSDSINKNLIPLFGENEKTKKEKDKDVEFIVMCTKNFPTLLEASKFFADRGWEYLSESQLDTATYRFNLCYLLNPKNVDAYWGLGVVQFQKGELDLAANILKKGIMVDSTNSSLIVDLATVEISCYEKNTHADDLAAAHAHLAKAIDIDPGNVTAWQKRSETEYYLENFENAWDCIHSARLLDITKVDLIFVGKLALKMPDPKGIFKF